MEDTVKRKLGRTFKVPKLNIRNTVVKSAPDGAGITQTPSASIAENALHRTGSYEPTDYKWSDMAKSSFIAPKEFSVWRVCVALFFVLSTLVYIFRREDENIYVSIFSKWVCTGLAATYAVLAKSSFSVWWYDGDGYDEGNEDDEQKQALATCWSVIAALYQTMACSVSLLPFLLLGSVLFRQPSAPVSMQDVMCTLVCLSVFISNRFWRLFPFVDF